ncbi:MAG: lysozyme [Bacteroides sp.]|nr:lysozyme [Bacteroides sp.]
MILRNFIFTVVATCSLLFGYVDMMVGANTSSQPVASEFEKAVEVIKKYEGLHKNKGNLVGYGHKILPGEPYKRNQTLTEEQADELLRKDLAKLCERYREFGKDSLILSALAYNCGIGVVAKSSVLKNLKAGNRDIKDAYLAHSKYRGKTLSQLKRRRTEEYEVLFKED